MTDLVRLNLPPAPAFDCKEGDQAWKEMQTGNPLKTDCLAATS